MEIRVENSEETNNMTFGQAIEALKRVYEMWAK